MPLINVVALFIGDVLVRSLERGCGEEKELLSIIACCTERQQREVTNYIKVQSVYAMFIF